ncbi:MAG: glycosyltransferase family 39 protein [Chloroflexi bacterium]|nr:glycosyltransferase family 39 protein [Chloroflexota bacterium]
MKHSSLRAYVILALIVLGWRLITALPLERAGYMDASYTQHVGGNLAQGRGFVQDVVWNYLEEQKTIPGSSNLYWLPLPSMLAASSMMLFGISYRAAQIPFILLSLIPPLFAFYLARRLYQRDDYAWMAGLLTAFSGFYIIYWVSPDNFTPFAVTADFALLFMAVGVITRAGRYFFLAGIFIGLAQLARADAVLLLLVAPILLVWHGRMEFTPTTTPSLPAQTDSQGMAVKTTPSLPAQTDSQGMAVKTMPSLPAQTDSQGMAVKTMPSLPGQTATSEASAAVTMGRFRVLVAANVFAWAGFLLVLAPWLVRNYFTVGSLLAPGSARTLWLFNYDEFFSFDVSRLTLDRYLAWGIGNIVASKLNALGFILLLLVGAGLVFLVPFQIIGFWKTRGRAEMQAALIYLALLMPAMAFVFTFPATHGSMLHSATAWVAYGAVAVPPGLDAAIAWIAKRRRRWNVTQAQKFFRAGTLLLAILLSLYLYASGVWLPPGQNATAPLWNGRDVEYAAIDAALDARGVPDTAPIITVDPPSFINETGRRSIYFPTESVDAIFDAAHQFDARYLVLQYDKPITVHALYEGKATVDGLTPVTTVRDALGRPVTLFEITR